MSARVSARGRVEPFHVMELLKAAHERQVSHGDVITMCAGQPSTPAPAVAREAAAAAMADGAVLGYTPAMGIPALQQAIAEHYADWYALDIDPNAIAITTGSSAGFTALFLAAFDPGDVVLMTRPGYPAYRNTLQALGCRAVELECGPEVRFQPTLAMLEQWSAVNGGPPAGLIIASPANPTGTVIAADELAAIARWCAEQDVLLVSDEIYHGVTFGEPATSAWATSRSGVLVGSMSKYFSMTGWRVGWLVLPEHLVRPIELLLGNLNICAPAISQVAATAALGPQARPELEGHVQRYAANRDVILSRLPELGISRWAPADGAFYAYADVSHLTNDSTRWCDEVLAATGVALTPGVDFAPGTGLDTSLDGNRWVRISLAGATDEMNEAMDRLATFA
ncbi:MAG: aminotransferase class I/II-fold pyridoxal phosphate-dependent enzyme [Intrasporangiaceae bacterium]|nr:aminotransferase class I/II-fold pyridoxal phosphate-dependent enzyme [Intrasporangiaceae bacterium]